VTWTPAADPDLAGYRIQVLGGGASLNLFAPAGAAQIPLANLRSGTSYTISITAVDTARNASSPTQTAFTTYPDEAPPAPADVVAADTRNGGELSVTWVEPESRVPVAGYRVTLTPAAPGWPAVGLDAARPPVRANGLFNRLPYVITVTAATPWGAVSDPSAGVPATPTAPARDLAVVPETGWPDERPDADAGGFTVRISPQTEDRELRFEYRTNRSGIGLVLDGTPLGRTLPDTLGAWVEERLPLAAKLLRGVTAHLLELRNTGFPDAAALASLRRLDLVPLAADGPGARSFNTVVDVTWTRPEARTDLTAHLSRRPADLGADAHRWEEVGCPAPSLARCRSTFQPNGQKTEYAIQLISPAGWQSERSLLEGVAIFEVGPPPVTDLLVTAVDGSAGKEWNLSWTPLSTAIGARAAPSRVSAYRIYRQEANALVLLREVSAPPVQLPVDVLDAAGRNVVVRSVDSLGRESQ
jgi:hypothetical protein